MRLKELLEVLQPEQIIRIYVSGKEGVGYEGPVIELQKGVYGGRKVSRIGDSGTTSRITIILEEVDDGKSI